MLGRLVVLAGLILALGLAKAEGSTCGPGQVPACLSPSKAAAATSVGGGHCVQCSVGFTGSRCETRLCYNGGTSTGGACLCPEGATGDHCENVACSPRSNETFPRDGLTMSLVLHTRYTMVTALSSAIDAVRGLASSFLADHPGLIKDFQITWFSDTVASSTTFATFAELNASLSSPGITSYTKCQPPLLTALSAALAKTSPGSPVFVLADGGAGDAERLPSLLASLAAQRSPVYFLLNDLRDRDPECGLQRQSPGYSVLRQTADLTGGLVLEAYNHDSGKLLAQTFPSAFGFATLAKEEKSLCEIGLLSFVAGEEAGPIQITVTGTMDNAPELIDVSGPNGSVQPESVFQVGSLGVWTVPGLPGQWYASFALRIAPNGPKSAPCSCRIRTESPIRIALGFSRVGISSDFQEFMPTQNEYMTPVVHLGGVRLSLAPSGEASWRTSEGKTLLGLRALRNGCQYQLAFQPWACTTADQLFTFTITIDDPKLGRLERAVTGYCVGSGQTLGTSTPTPTTPATAKCSLDVLFVLDRSESVQQDNWDRVTTFVADFAQALQDHYGIPIGQEGNQIRIGLVSYATGVSVDLKLSDSTSLSVVQQRVRGIKYQRGLSSLPEALDVAAQQLSAANGDRLEPSCPDIVVLISDGLASGGAGNLAQSAANLKNAVRAGQGPSAKQSSGKILAVAIQDQSGVNYDNLRLITGDSSNIFTASSGYAGLLNITDKIINDICPPARPRSCYGDVGFVVETTELSEGNVNYVNNVKAWLNLIGDSLNIPGVNGGRDAVGVAHFGQKGQRNGVQESGVDANITQRTEAQIRAALDLIPFGRGESGETDLELALVEARALQQAAAYRDQTPNFRFIVLVTQAFCDVPSDDSPACYSRAFAAADSLRNQYGVEIYILLVGPRASYSNALRLTGYREGNIVDTTAGTFNSSQVRHISTAINSRLAGATCAPIQ